MKHFTISILLNFAVFNFVFAEADLVPDEISSELQNTERAVWRIHRLDKPIGGTAFFIGKNRFVTNFHVIYGLLGLSLEEALQDDELEDRDSDSYIVLSQEQNSFALRIKRVVAASALHDLALLEIEGEVTDYLSLREHPPEPSENLFLIAYPGGVLTTIKKTGDIVYEDDQVYAFLVDYSNLGGSSGSPILDTQRQVVGVTSFNIHNLQTMVKMNYLKELIAGDIGTQCSEFEDSEGLPASKRACIKKEVKELRELIKNEFVYPQYKFALLYKLEEDGISEAFPYFAEAAEYGYLPAIYEIALAVYIWYHRGIVSREDLDKAFQWMEVPAEEGYIPAQYQIGAMYYSTEGKQDVLQAFYWARQAAERGFSPAQHLLGVIYHVNYKIGEDQQDLDQAVQWIQKSAEQGYEPAKNYYDKEFSQ